MWSIQVVLILSLLLNHLHLIDNKPSCIDQLKNGAVNHDFIGVTLSRNYFTEIFISPINTAIYYFIFIELHVLPVILEAGSYQTRLTMIGYNYEGGKHSNSNVAVCIKT